MQTATSLRPQCMPVYRVRYRIRQIGPQAHSSSRQAGCEFTVVDMRLRRIRPKDCSKRVGPVHSSWEYCRHRAMPFFQHTPPRWTFRHAQYITQCSPPPPNSQPHWSTSCCLDVHNCGSALLRWRVSFQDSATVSIETPRLRPMVEAAR